MGKLDVEEPLCHPRDTKEFEAARERETVAKSNFSRRENSEFPTRENIKSLVLYEQCTQWDLVVVASGRWAIT